MPADESDPPARLERARRIWANAFVGCRRTSLRNARTGCRTPARRCWRRPPGTGPAYPLWRKRARSADQRFGYVHAQHLAPRADAGGQSQTRRARAAADVQHAPARRGRGGFDRGLAEHRQPGIEPGLVGDPALPVWAFQSAT